jgi:SPP1 gp7 family putative phage head morphogenesis protein
MPTGDSTFDQVRKPALAFEPGAGVSDFFAGTKDEFLRSAFGRPVAIERVKQLAGRVFHGPPGVGLRGVTQEMAERMSQTLTDGLVQGKNPREIARDLAKAIDVGKKRAEMIARTEVIRAHAEGQLDVMERLGVEEVGVMVEWSTAGDDRVCPMCQPLEGIVMKIREARGTLPRHPLCRCSYIPANVGEPKGEKREVDFTDPDTGEVKRQEVGQTRTAKQLREARDESIRGEFRGRKDPGTLADMRKKSRWTGADRRFAKVRPQSVLDKPPKKLKPPKPKPSRAKITVSPEDEKFLSDAFGGRKVTKEEVAELAGALDDAEVIISVERNPQSLGIDADVIINVSVDGPGYGGDTLITLKGKKGDVSLTDLFVDKSKRGKGIGTEFASRQVEQARKLGFDVQLFAEGSFQGELNGYYTWPRLGFDGPLPKGWLKNAGKRGLKEVPEFAKEAKNVSDLMRTPEGREFWKRWGSPLRLKMDTKPGSQGLRVLQEYAKKKGI